MDYPKSVPGVGLVGGKFVDENAATGQQGSLIPSAWGNAVTEEISNVIKDGGDEPVEGDVSQLQKAIRKIVSLVWPKASDAEVSEGLVDDKVVTPKKLRSGFAIRLAVNGYIAFPSWMGGLILEWGSVGTFTTGVSAITFPLAFPGGVPFVVVGMANAGSAVSVSFSGQTSAGVSFSGFNSVTGDRVETAVYWFVIGR
ncbi:MAG: hypothetical protein AB7U71_16500 [Comamonas sp.]